MGNIKFHPIWTPYSHIKKLLMWKWEDVPPLHTHIKGRNIPAVWSCKKLINSSLNLNSGYCIKCLKLHTSCENIKYLEKKNSSELNFWYQLRASGFLNHPWNFQEFNFPKKCMGRESWILQKFSFEITCFARYRTVIVIVKVVYALYTFILFNMYVIRNVIF